MMRSCPFANFLEGSWEKLVVEFIGDVVIKNLPAQAGQVARAVFMRTSRPRLPCESSSEENTFWSDQPQPVVGFIEQGVFSSFGS